MAERKKILIGLALLLSVAAIAAWLYWQFCPQAKGPSHPAESLAKAGYVGATACAECHRPQYDAWKGSHHALSMQSPSPQTVLGDFKDASFSYNGVVSRFFQREGKFFVNTDGPGGQPSDYEIKYAFGLTPLQQYLIELPGGRMQALSIAWDSRDKQQGGQRWFHLYPDEKVGHDDPLHWTGPYQNWNFMCADCHSTQVRHNFNADTGQFNTQWNEINVACEACHGPGSKHVEWAQHQSGVGAMFKRKDEGNGLAVDVSGRQKPGRIEQMHQSTSLSFKEGAELKTCAVCHARRSALTNEFIPAEGFDQHFLAALLRPELYFEDGQIKDEVYEYNSFRQSKMFAKGVTCSDCHEPHALKLRGDVQTVCLQCHEASRYEATAHHHHADNGQVKCVDCHMPQKTYMVVDPRRDHSFRVPRPDLSERYGVPNACARCHGGKDAAWAANAVRTWLGRDAQGLQRFAEAFHKVRATEAGAEQALREVLHDPTEPPVVKGSLLAEAGGFLYAIADEVKTGLHADAVAERLGALSAIENLPIAQRWPLAEHLLRDPERNVRIEAARLLLDPALDERQKQQIAKPLAELQEAARIYASRPQWRMIAGGVASKLGNREKAIEDYEAALQIQPSLTQAYANLADTYRELGDEAKAYETLGRGLKLLPREGALHYAKGLSEIRQKQTAQGMKELKQATELSPDDRVFAYAYAVGLYSQGDKKAAFAFLQKRLEAHPSERNNLYLLVQLAGREDRTEMIAPYIPLLKQLLQADPQAKQLLMWLGSGPAR
ncbi:MAG: multiheme c-type cytochrome [Candidatus Methylumidiphilus sp.]